MNYPDHTLTHQKALLLHHLKTVEVWGKTTHFPSAFSLALKELFLPKKVFRAATASSKPMCPKPHFREPSRANPSSQFSRSYEPMAPPLVHFVSPQDNLKLHALEMLHVIILGIPNGLHFLHFVCGEMGNTLFWTSVKTKDGKHSLCC